MAIPEYRYIFEDTLTRIKSAAIPMYGVNLQSYLNTQAQSNKFGAFTGTFRADLPGFRVQELLDATIPYRSNLWVERDGSLIWGGYVTSRTYQSESLTYQIYAQTFDTFTQGDFHVADGTITDDPQNVIIQQWNTMQARTNENLGVVIPTAVTSAGNMVSSWVGTDNTPTSDLIATAVKSGAEYRFDYAYSTTGVRTATLRVGRWDLPNLTIGSPVSSQSTTLKYPGDLSNYWLAEGSGSALTILSIGKANGASTPRSTQTNTPLLNTGWPNYQAKENWSDVSDQTTLTNMTIAALQTFAPPYVSPTFKSHHRSNRSGHYGSTQGGKVAFPFQTDDTGFGNFTLGDYVHVVLVDKYRFPSGPFAANYRVVGWSLSPAAGTTPEALDFTLAQPFATG